MISVVKGVTVGVKLRVKLMMKRRMHEDDFARTDRK